jgi:hypothetical protein
VPAPYGNIHELYHAHYARGGSIAAWADQLHQNARIMLQRTAILPSLSRANLLLDVLERFTPAERFGDESEQSRFFGIFRLLTECYEVIADDLLILSALEIHAKATLLKAGYVIHDIRKPTALRQRQKERPIHVRTVRANINKGEDVVFAQTTLGVSTWLQQRYVRFYPLPAGAVNALAEVRRRRNFVHFAEPYTWTVDRNLLELVGHLNNVIPQIRVRTKRPGQRRGA